MKCLTVPFHVAAEEQTADCKQKTSHEALRVFWDMLLSKLSVTDISEEFLTSLRHRRVVNNYHIPVTCLHVSEDMDRIIHRRFYAKKSRL